MNIKFVWDRKNVFFKLKDEYRFYWDRKKYVLIKVPWDGAACVNDKT